MSNKRGLASKFPHNKELCRNYSNLLQKDNHDIFSDQK